MKLGALPYLSKFKLTGTLLLQRLVNKEVTAPVYEEVLSRYCLRVWRLGCYTLDDASTSTLLL
jgi:hypothetical protein